MGYTHYYQRVIGKDHDQETWNKFVADCKYLYKHMPEHSKSAGDYYSDRPLMLNGCGGYEKPQFTKTRIYFNGTGTTKRITKSTTDTKTGKVTTYWEDDETGLPDELKDLGHETFVILRKVRKQDDWRSDKKAIFNFCKTACKPYDLMVTACLILYKYYFRNDVQISSDGNEEDWSEACKFIGVALPHGKGVIVELKLSEILFERNIA